jgi:tape measure domain-containing protein
MTTERIRIEFTQTGARAVRRDFEGVAAGANTASRALGGLGTALKAAVAGAVVRETIKLADGYTDLTNRIRVVTRSEQEAVAVRSELLRVSNQTRGDVDALGAVYGRLALTTKNLGLSQREVIDLTQSLQQATTLSGASTEGAAAALMQLSQGFSEGVLRGENLNSVLEQTPVIAQTIADGLKVDIGQLRALGAEGKIAPRDIVNAFKAAREELADRFGKAVPPVRQSITVLMNSVTELVGELDSATGATSTLSQNILSFAENLREAIPQLKVIIGSLTDLSNIKGPGDWFFEMFSDQSVSKLEFWSLGIASIKEGIAALSNVPSLGFTRAFDEAGARFQQFMRDLSDARAMRLGARFPDSGIGPPLPPGHALTDPLAAKPTAPIRAPLAEATKGPTVASVLADLKREGELLRMTNEERRIEEALDRARSALKGRLGGQQEALLRHQIEENRVLEVVNESLEEKLRLELELMEVEQQRLGEIGDREARRAQEREELAAFERQKAFDNTFEGQKALMTTDFLDNVRSFGAEMAVIFGPGGTLQQGLHGVVGSLSDAIVYSIAFGRSWNDTEEAIKNIGRSIVAEIISSLIRIPIQLAINETIASGLRAKATVETTAQAATIAGAMAPAAAATSLATAGTNSAGATAAIIGAAALAAGVLGMALFEEGGYTGNGSRSGVAGLVHGKEFVLHADATKRYRGEAEAMNAGTYRGGGGGGSVSVTIVDQTDGATRFETRQLSESEVEIIVRRVAPDAVAQDIRSPQGRVPRAMSQEFGTKRVRA